MADDLRTYSCAEVDDLAPLFVLGALAPDEADAVRAHLASCPSSHAAVAELGGAAQALAEIVPIVPPPAALRERVLAAAASAGTPVATTSVAAAPPAAPSVSSDQGPSTRVSTGPARVSPDRRVITSNARFRDGRSIRTGWVMAIAAVLAIVALGGWNLSLQSRLGDAERYATALGAVLDLTGHPGTATAALAPATSSNVEGVAAVASDGATAIAIRGLAPTTGSQVYEAWAIVGKNAPVPIGSTTVGRDGVAVLRTRSPAPSTGTVIALTLEPRPGMTAPTLPILVSGALGSAS